MLKQLRTASLLLVTVTGLSQAQGTAEIMRKPSPAGAEAYIQSPANGASTRSPVTIRFGLRGMGVAPAGVDLPNTGHHHLLIDVAESPAFDTPLPASENVRHFGGGQTEVELELAPGRHTLQLVLGDYLHIPHQPPIVSEQITITVTE